MSRFYAPSAGTNDVMAMITAIGNVDEFRQKLERLQSAEQALNDKIALTGKAEDITRLHAEASEARALATKTLEDSQLRAKEILDNAQLAAAKTAEVAALNAAQTREDALTVKKVAQQQADAIIANAQAVEKQLQAKEEALAAEKADFQVSKKLVAAQQQAVLEREQDLETREIQVASEWEDIRVAKKQLDERRRDSQAKAKELIDFALTQKRGYEEFIARLNG